MTFIEVAGAVGLGALITKILDIVWLQRMVQRNERAKWLREQRLRVYSSLAAEIMSLGKQHGTCEDIFKSITFPSEAILLVDNDALAKRLENFFIQLPNLYAKATMEAPDVPSQDVEAAYAIVQENSKRLIIELRKSLQSS